MGYEHARSEPEDSYPQTAYFYVPGDAAADVENALREPAGRHGFDAEVV